MMRLAAWMIALICIAPVTVVLLAWALPLTPLSQESWEHLRTVMLPEYLATTLWLGAGAVAVSLCFGTLSAWLVTHFRFPGSQALEWALILPLAVPGYIAALAYGYLFDFAGPVQSALREWFGWRRGDYWFPPVRSLGGAIFLLGMATTPYIYLLARTAFLSQPREWEEAAASLGAGRWRIFRTVTLPVARPFLAGGAALAMMEVLADIGTVGLLGVPTLSAGVYRTWFHLQEPLLAARMAGLLVLFALLLMAVERFSRGGMRYASVRATGRAVPTALHGGRGLLACALAAIPVIFGFLIPLLVLLRLVSYYWQQFSLESWLPTLGDTVLLAGLAALITAGAALLLVGAERFHPRSAGWIGQLAALGYALPGAVIAIGLLVLFGWLRGYVPDGVLTGSLTGLMLAYLARFMATAYHPLHAGALRIPPELDMASATLGKSRGQTFRRIHLPLLLLPALAAATMVWIDTLKELPATLILRPFDIRTFAMRSYELASDDRAVEASPHALALVVLSVLGVWVLHRLKLGREG